MPEIRVGISGWNYPPWRGNFYPEKLTQQLELAYASRRFNAIEINGTFYSLQRPASFQAWYAATPPGFVFALKGGRFLTHMLKLKNPRQALANYFASGMLGLREKLGPILWQFPAAMPFHEDRFQEFFELLPRDTLELASLAREHAPILKGRVFFEPDAPRTVRHAVEFRHETFLSERFIALLRKHNIALVVADVASKYPTAEDVTADWVYVRLHGSRQLYVSGYSPREIDAWAAKIRAWHQGAEPTAARRICGPAKPATKGRDVYVFFDNTDVKLRAPVDARRMAKVLGVGPRENASRVLADLGMKPRAKNRKRASRKPGR
ncbi:MAG TPA: DUF72 domain-containing protein [Pirellulales bacterium]|nr:DUF72 domain-containing protein [Pirellulales bacterium]